MDDKRRLTDPPQRLPLSVLRMIAIHDEVYLLVGLKYARTIWEDLWPRVMSNAIEACKHAGAKLLFFDNVYMYGRVSGPMTETSSIHAAGKVKSGQGSPPRSSTSGRPARSWP